MPRCLATAILIEFSANVSRHYTQFADYDDMQKLETVEWFMAQCAELQECYLDLTNCFDPKCDAMNWQTFVIIERGPNKGLTGTICGTISGRREQIAAGLTKVIVKVDDEFHTVLIENIRELSTHEQILLGLK